MIPPAQLWIGSAAQMQQQIIAYVQSQLCTQQGCGTCTTCRHIAQQQQHNVCWVLPEKNQYSKADCEIIAQKSAFMLEPGELFFFILPFAELLTPSSANSLLKLVEEPPQGYHFIFCAERPGMLLPTIISRCVVTTFSTEERTERATTFLQLFKEPHAEKLGAFSKLYETAAVTEQTTSLLLDELLLFWRDACGAGDDSLQNGRAQSIITHITDAYQRLPMPGSAKLFWRNLFIKMLDL